MVPQTNGDMKIRAMAALRRGAELDSWSYDSPPLGPFDCLLKVTACGLCYSDIHMIDNDWAISRHPLVPGHEIVGKILELGDQATHLKLGDRVGVGWERTACLQCRDCLRGNENLCKDTSGLIVDGYGGFADHVVADSRFCFPLPGRIPSDVAGPLLCGGITVYAALRYAGMTSGQEIGVIGLGGLGHLAVQFAAKLGNRVTVFTASEDKTSTASRLGAAAPILIKERQPSTIPDRPLNILLSTVPAHLPWDDYLELLDPDGTLTFVGVPSGPLTLSLDNLLLKRRRVMANPIAGRAMIQETLELAGRFSIAPVVETFALAEANLAIRRLRENRIRYRAVLMV